MSRSIDLALEGILGTIKETHVQFTFLDFWASVHLSGNDQHWQFEGDVDEIS